MAEAKRLLRKRLAVGEESRRSSFPVGTGQSPSLASPATPARSFSLKGVLTYAKNKGKRFSTASIGSMPILTPQVLPEITADTDPSRGTVKRMEPRNPLTSPSLLSLPASDLWLQVETSDFDSTLANAVEDLRNDLASGARQLADASLHHLARLSDTLASATCTWDEFWSLLVYAAKRLSGARPYMGAAITACLLRALERIGRKWNEEVKDARWSPSDLACVARSTFDEIQRERKQLDCELGTNFAQWVCDRYEEEAAMHKNTIRILTLGNSSTISTAILHTLATLPEILLHITILESRPRCEGADMAAQIYHSALDRGRLSIRIIPDSFVGTATQDIDIVLLGADRISSNGNISYKIGSLAATLCAKMHNEEVAIVVLSDSEKITAYNRDIKSFERHSPSELSAAWSPETRIRLEGKTGVDVFGEWFEWIPARRINAYVTEEGVLEVDQVRDMAKQIKELEEYIFRR